MLLLATGCAREITLSCSAARKKVVENLMDVICGDVM